MTKSTRLTSTQVVEMARAPDNKQFIALWRRLRKPSGEPPSFAEFNLNHLQQFAESIAVLRPTDVGDFFYSYFGQRKGPSSRRDLTGRFHSEVDHPIADALAACFREVIDTGRPLLVTHGNMRNRTVHTWEEVLVPVDGPFGRQVVTHAVAVAFKNDLIGSILQSSPAPILACAVDVDRTTSDLAIRVQAASRTAATLFDLPLQNLIGCNPFDLVPAEMHSALRAVCLQVIADEEQGTLSLTLGKAKLGHALEQDFDVTISPFDGGLVLTLCSPSALKASRAEEPVAILN